MALQHDPIVALAVGVQRGERILMRLSADALRPGDAFSLAVACADGSEHAVDINPTADDRVEKALDAVVGRMVKNRQATLSALDDHRHFEWTLPHDRIVSTLDLRLRRDEIIHPIAWLDLYGLSCRVPADREAFRRSLTFPRHRMSDKQSLHGAAMDTLRHHLAAGVSVAEAPYVVNAFVVAMYKAIELEEDTAQVDRFSEGVSALLPSIPSSKSIKDDRHVVELSFLTARWHHAVAAGDIGLLTEVLHQIETLSKPDQARLGAFGFNATRSLLLYGVMAARADPARAIALLELTYARFRAAAAFITYRAVQLKEVGASLEVSVLAMHIRKALKQGKPISGAYVRAVVGRCARADSAAFREKLRALIDAA